MFASDFEVCQQKQKKTTKNSKTVSCHPIQNQPIRRRRSSKSQKQVELVWLHVFFCSYLYVFDVLICFFFEQERHRLPSNKSCIEQYRHRIASIVFVFSLSKSFFFFFDKNHSYYPNNFGCFAKYRTHWLNFIVMNVNHINVVYANQYYMNWIKKNIHDINYRIRIQTKIKQIRTILYLILI